MKFKNFIWDFDGTLVETYYHTTEALILILNKYGRTVDRKEAELSLRDSFSKAKQNFNLTDEMYKEFMDKVHELWFEPKPFVYEGVEELLLKIVERGGKNFIYTNRNHTAKLYLEQFKLDKYFADYITKESEFYSFKPSPQAIDYLVAKHSLIKEETVMVGDREIDVLSGKSADIGAILFDEFKNKEPSAADIIVHKISDISKYVK